MASRDFAADLRLPAPWNLGLAVPGGFLNGRKDPPQGHQGLRKGRTGLAVLARGVRKTDPHGPGEQTVSAIGSRLTSRASGSAPRHRVGSVDTQGRLQEMRRRLRHPKNIKPMPDPSARTFVNQASAEHSGRIRAMAYTLDLQVTSKTLSAPAKPSNTLFSYAFSRVFSGSNIDVREATVTGKHSFMYCTCSLVPATARSIGR